MRVPIRRDLRHLQAVAMGGWLPLPRRYTSGLPESLKSSLYNFQSFGWDLDVSRQGSAQGGVDWPQPGVSDAVAGRNRWDWRLDRGTLSPPPVRPQGAGVCLNFFPLFLGGVNDR